MKINLQKKKEPEIEPKPEHPVVPITQPEITPVPEKEEDKPDLPEIIPIVEPGTEREKGSK